MIKNVQSLKDKSIKFAKKNNISVQTVLQNFMFGRFLERLSKSKYKENFIIKGGILVSSIMGVNLRATMDIDADIIGISFSEEQIIEIINNIINVDLMDNIFFTFDKCSHIREDNEYGGYSIKLIGQFFNIKVPFHIDVSTGDIITPRAIKYKYKEILEDNYIDLFTFNYETIISEKYQTVLVRNIGNSRMKDFYDLYYFTHEKWNEIDKKILKQAIITTFKKRDSLYLLNEYHEIKENIKNSDELKTRWKKYQQFYSYAENISYENLITFLDIIYQYLN